MATVNLGRIKFVWQGAYSGATAYVADDVVSYNGSSYICILASTNNLPTNTTYWNLMAQTGTDITSLAGLAQGDVLYYNGTAWVRLGAGTSGQYLKTNGASANPSWANGSASTLTTQGDILYRDASGLQRLGAGTSGQFLQTNGSGANPAWATLSDSFGSRLLHVRDEKANNTGAGSTSTSWFKRTLNTIMTNEISGASLSSSVITLPSGTYYIQSQVPTSVGERFKAKLRNTSDSTDTLISSSGFGDGVSTFTDNSWVFISGRFTIAAQKNFEIQMITQTTGGGSGSAGTAANLGVVEVYTDVQLWKVA